VLESLTKAGAFDSLGWKRSQCFHMIDKMIDFSHQMQKMRASNQSLLFGKSHIESPEMTAEISQMREWDKSLQLTYEKDAVGFYITGHPLAQIGPQLQRLVSHTLNQLDDEKDFNSDVRVAGIISAVKPIRTKKDERMATFILEDLSGRIEVIVFPDSYKKYYNFLREDQLVWVKGRFIGEGDSRKIHCVDIMLLADAFQKQAKRVILRIFLPGLEASVFEELREMLEKFQGTCPLLFELETPHSYRMVAQAAEVQGVLPSEDLRKNVERLLGEGSVLIEY